MKKNLYLQQILVLPMCIPLVTSCAAPSKNDSQKPNPEKPPIETPPIDPSLPKGWNKYVTDDSNLASQISLENARKLHFNYPNYNGDKSLVTLRADGAPSHNIPGEGVPSGPQQYSKEGVITTEKHAQLAKQVYSVSFHNGVQQVGTAWILDYKLTNDGTYPVTWYFGTNAHVLDDLKVADDILYPEKFGGYSKKLNNYRSINTEAISLWGLRDPKPGKYGNNSYGHQWKSTYLGFWQEGKGYGDEGYYLEKTPVKTIFTGNDFLKTSPSDFSTNSYSNKEEYADFGVFEITFKSPEQAKETTNDYANWKEEDKFKYHKDDLVNNPSLQTEKVYTVGFPEDSSYGNGYRVVASNVNQVEYDENRDKGNGLSKSIHYNSWSNRYGMYDGLIGMPWFGYTYEWIDNSSDDYNTVKRSTPFSTYGLIYGTNSGNMRAGSSGSLVVDENGYALGIHFASDNNAATGQAQAFYSGGFNYNGYYGNYILPQYDLIRGGYPDQKNSYYDGLVKMYGKDANFKTRLFPNGLISRN